MPGPHTHTSLSSAQGPNERLGGHLSCFKQLWKLKLSEEKDGPEFETKMLFGENNQNGTEAALTGRLEILFHPTTNPRVHRHTHSRIYAGISSTFPFWSNMGEPGQGSEGTRKASYVSFHVVAHHCHGSARYSS